MAHAAHDPSWVARVRVQLDAVCGTNAERLPEYSDWDDLPLIHATIKECLRIFPNMLRIGAPHALTYCLDVEQRLMIRKDDEYNGYRMEAGTVFVSNNYHIATSEAEYPDARRFIPERYSFFMRDGADEKVYERAC
jgi:cytochrome P450